MKHFILYLFILLGSIFYITIVSSCENISVSKNTLEKWFEDESFFILVSEYQEKPLKFKTFHLLGKIKTKEKIYKSKNSKIKVRMIWGEGLINGWESLLFRVFKIDKSSLKELEIKGIIGYLYKKPGNKHSIIFPIFRNSDKAFLICFDFNHLSLKESLYFLEKFPLEKFRLKPCSQN